MSARVKLDDALVASRPAPCCASPTQLSLSPCKQYLTFLQPSSSSDLLTRHLYYLNLSTHQQGKVWDPSDETETEESLSLEEKLRRERSRQMDVGITHYAWSAMAPRLIIPLNGNIFVKETKTLEDPKAIRLVFDKNSVLVGDNATGGAIDTTLSPDGSLVGFVRDSELYVMPIEEGIRSVPLRLTFDARETEGRTNGLADYLAQEEMDRYKGFWFSPCSRYMAFEQVDEAHIPQYRIMHQGSDSVGQSAQEDHRYPFAGMENPKVKLAVVDIKKALAEGPPPQIQWLDLVLKEDGFGEDFYLARVDWFPDGSLAVQVENREQSELVLLRYDIHTGERAVLVREKSNVWINLNDIFVAFESGDAEKAFGISSDAMEISNSSSGKNGFFFTWGSERSGFMHVYLYYYYAANGKVDLVRQLTSGEWMVGSLAQLSIEKGLLFFNTTADSPLERHVYACQMWGDNDPSTIPKLHKVTTNKGSNSLVIDSDLQFAINSFNSVEVPPSTTFCRLAISDSAITLEDVFVMHDGNTSELVREQREALREALQPPEFVTFPSKDGKVTLYGAVSRPDPKRFGAGPYPLIVAVYGGPHVQRVLDSWLTTSDMRVQRFVDDGYLVLKVDNRGSSGRGLAFEGAIKHRMGTIEVEDQATGVEFLVNKGLADPERVGIYGWSYGGYMSLMCLMQRPDIFHVAVSGAPVTHWDGYDTHYTERYMGTPQSNPEGYEIGAVMKYVSQLEGKLMLVHGLIDENVHFRHTARLINSLIAARKTYDLLLFPEERHSPRRLQDRIYMEQRIKAYFDENLRNRKSNKH